MYGAGIEGVPASERVRGFRGTKSAGQEMKALGPPFGVFTRRWIEVNGPGRPGILARGSSRASPVFPRRPGLEACATAVAADLRSAMETSLPAYSGGTAWASHPLRMTAGRLQDPGLLEF